VAFAAEIPCSSQSLGAGKGRSAEESSLGLSDPGPKLGLHQSIDLLGRSVKARPDQRANTLQEREQVSARFCFTRMAFHHSVYHVKQAIGGVGQGRLGAIESLLHQGSLSFFNRSNLSHNCLKPKIELFGIDSPSGGYCRAGLPKAMKRSRKISQETGLGLPRHG